MSDDTRGYIPRGEYFTQRLQRLHDLAVELGISPNSTETEVWAFVGQVLAQEHEIFRGFPIFLNYVPPSPRGRPSKESGAKALAVLVDEYREKCPEISTDREAITKLIELGLIFKRGGVIESRLKALSKGRAIIRAEAAEAQKREDENANRLAEGRRREKPGMKK